MRFNIIILGELFNNTLNTLFNNLPVISIRRCKESMYCVYCLLSKCYAIVRMLCGCSSSSICNSPSCNNIQDSEDTLGGKLEHCNNAEKQVTTSETGSENDKEEGEGEDIEDQDEMEEEDMLFEEELEEEEEEEMVEGEISRVVFKRASLNRDISDVSDQFSKSKLCVWFSYT